MKRRPASETLSEVSDETVILLSESFGTRRSEINEKNAKTKANIVNGRPFISRLLKIHLLRQT